MSNFIKKILVLLTFLLISFFEAKANHLLGGEISIKNVKDSIYILSLNYYQDNAQISQGRPTIVGVYFYNKQTGAFITNYTLTRSKLTVLENTTSLCNYLNPVGTEVIQFIFTAQIAVRSAIFKNVNDIFAIYTNSTYSVNVANLWSPQSQGFTLYDEMLYFNKIINSSPEFNPTPRNIYGCVGMDFNYDYSATDKDKDSLVYELMIPNNEVLISSKINNINPVYLKLGYSLQNIILGNPPLTINSVTGLLKLKASLAGTYVFAVRVKEYRKGVYLGNNTSIHQMFVFNCHKINNKPKLEVIDPQTNLSFTKKYTVNLDNRFENCINLAASDTSSGQTFKVSVSAHNFSDVSINSVATLSSTTYITTSKTDKFIFPLCIPKCIPTSVKNPIVKIVLGSNNNCSLINYDTLLVTINNTFTGSTLQIITNPVSTVQTAFVNKLFNLTVSAFSNTSNQFVIKADGNDYNSSLYNMTFNPKFGSLTTITSVFSLIPKCSDIAKGSFLVHFVAYENNTCFPANYILPFKINIVDSSKINPKISINPTLTLVNASIGKPLNIQITATVGNSDNLMIYAKGKNFKLSDKNMAFNSVSGINTITSTFTYLPYCTHLTQSPYLVWFFAKKLGCSEMYDSIPIQVVVKDDSFAKSLLTINPNLTEQDAFIGKKLTIKTSSLGNGVDKVLLSVRGINFNLSSKNMTFITVSGMGTVTSDFNYSPICSYLTQSPYSVIFYAKNLGCQKSYDSLIVKINTKEQEPIVPILSINPYSLTMDAFVGQNLTLQLKAVNNAYDKLFLYTKGKNFNLADRNMVSTSVTGISTITSTFSFKPKCADLSKSPFTVQFYAKTNGCTTKFDSNLVIFNVKEPFATLPKIHLNPFAPNFDVKIGEQISIQLTGTNNGKDKLSIYAKGKGFNFSDRSMVCNPVNGTGTITSEFNFKPLCSDLEFKPYSVVFYAKTTGCFSTIDSTTVTFNPIDTTFNYKLELINFFSPNGDGINDYFDMSNLPSDNCAEKFSLIEIFNRWGNRIFKSTDRNFKWDANDLPDGMYFYQIVYKNISYKSWIQIIR
jgi:gliding motility-associated-like protein